MNKRLQRSIALVIACSLSGCAIVSPQLKPEVPVAGTWNEATPADAAPVSPTWWTAFGSPELESLVAESLAGSPDLAIATERVQQAEALVRSSAPRSSQCSARAAARPAIARAPSAAPRAAVPSSTARPASG